MAALAAVLFGGNYEFNFSYCVQFPYKYQIISFIFSCLLFCILLIFSSKEGENTAIYSN